MLTPMTGADRRGMGCLLAVVFTVTVPVMMGVLMLPGRLIVTLWGGNRPMNTLIGVVLVGLIGAALAGTVALHVKMWRTFMRRDDNDNDSSG